MTSYGIVTTTAVSPRTATAALSAHSVAGMSDAASANGAL
jgi:hypothetical protein